MNDEKTIEELAEGWRAIFGHTVLGGCADPYAETLTVFKNAIRQGAEYGYACGLAARGTPT